MKKYFLLILLLAGNIVVKAQRCLTTEKRLEAGTDSLVKNEREKLEQFTAQWILNNRSQSRAIYRIPVVVHVIYRTATQNISDAQVLSQITALNKDFRRLNSDTSKTPAAFKPIAADCEIEFCLAQLDPLGDTTTGITRTSTTVSGIGGTNKYYQTSQGGINAWDRKKYMNIWVCEINAGGGTLGFAYLPGDAAASYDGVVIDYRYFGTTGTVSSPYNKGRTATHEVGHFLNLEHIWGDDGGSCSGSDFITDTPNQASERYNCPTFPQTDACSSNSPGIMFMNYMDYTSDACMNLFTVGQKNRMLATLSSTVGDRSFLIASPVCLLPPDTSIQDTTSNVSIKEQKIGKSFAIYPNPSNGNFKVVFAENTSGIELIIYDLLGKILYHKTFSDGKNSMEINSGIVKPGVYFIRVKKEDHFYTDKIIVSE